MFGINELHSGKVAEELKVIYQTCVSVFQLQVTIIQRVSSYGTNLLPVSKSPFSSSNQTCKQWLLLPLAALDLWGGKWKVEQLELCQSALHVN